MLCTAPWAYSVPHISLIADKKTIRLALAMVAIGTEERKRIILLNKLALKRYAKILPNAVIEIRDLRPPQESSTRTEQWRILIRLDSWIACNPIEFKIKVAKCAAIIFSLKQIYATTTNGKGIMKIKKSRGNNSSLKTFFP